MAVHNLYLDLEYLSNIELYYTSPGNCKEDFIIIDGEEFKHIVKVMRHSAGDEVYVTNGAGQIFNGCIKDISKDYLTISINKIFNYENNLSGITFCIPKLKNPERFEFALEKSTEMGITNFIVYDAERSISKSAKIERWNKIILSAMKQSLRSFLPVISTSNSLKEICKLNGEKIIFEQNAEKSFIKFEVREGKKYYFIFGPEGGLTSKELGLFDKNKFHKLAENRLRTETAVVKCAALLGK